MVQTGPILVPDGGGDILTAPTSEQADPTAVVTCVARPPAVRYGSTLKS